jgi:hypothetical protein
LNVPLGLVCASVFSPICAVADAHVKQQRRNKHLPTSSCHEIVRITITLIFVISKRLEHRLVFVVLDRYFFGRQFPFGPDRHRNFVGALEFVVSAGLIGAFVIASLFADERTRLAPVDFFKAWVRIPQLGITPTQRHVVQRWYFNFNERFA